MLIPQYASAGTTLAWFTDATIENSTKLSAPSGAPALVSGGTYNNCLDLKQSVALSDVTLSPANGTIGFWLRPKWNGSSGSNHKILRIGNPSTTSDGLLIEINKNGILRYIMAGGGKVTVARTDVSSWKRGEWHQVQVGWLEKDGTPTGLAIWIDRTAVSSVVFGGTRYMNQAAMQDKNVYIGDASSKAFMDELIFRDNLMVYSRYTANGGLPIAYRDYFRTAPYTSIQITNKAQVVNSDKRVIAGFKKQFGVIATKTVNAETGATTKEYITNFDGPTNSTWDEFDARKYIDWSSDSTSNAIVDANGLVTGVAPTTKPIALTARFRDMSAAYPLNVISVDQPDLDLMYVERTPKYPLHSNKIWPSTGEQVTSIVHYANFGYRTCNSFKIKFELIKDNNLNFKLDKGDTPVGPPVIKKITTPLEPGNKTGTVSFKWRWPVGNASDPPVFVKVTLDPDNEVAELCEANNERCDLNTGRLVHWGYGRDAAGKGDNDSNFVNDYTGKVINLVGSFSDYDWCQSNVERMNMMLRESVYPTTSPVGIKDSVRLDKFHTLDEYLEDHNNPHGLYQGGYEEMWDTRMTLSPGQIHEMGHTCLGLPDMYGQGISVCNVLLNDEHGNTYGGTPLYPVVTVRDDVGPWTSATWGYPDALGVGYTPLMINNHQWLDAHQAGWVNKYAKLRVGIPDTFGEMVPNETKLQLFDVNDKPLTNARVYAYQCINTGCIYMPNKYYPNRPKFIFTDNGTGIYTIPKTTSEYWDDWETDKVERSVPSPIPFDRTNTKAYGPSWQVGEQLLLKIVGADGKVEFQTLPLSEFNVAYLSGNTKTWTRPVRTSLTSPATPPAILAPTVPAGDYNYKPVPLIKYNGVTYSSNMVITVPYSETQATHITLDGSPSHDYGNEGQPLQYRWSIFSGSLNAVHNITIPAGTAPGDYDIRFYVIDGLRFSIFDGGVIRIVMPEGSAK